MPSTIGAKAKIASGTTASHGFLSGIMGALLKGEHEAAPQGSEAAGSESVLKDFDKMCADLRKQVEVIQTAGKPDRARGAHAVKLSSKEELERKLARIEATYMELRKEILEMHQRFGTGLDEDELQHNCDILREVAGMLSDRADKGVEAAVRAKAAERIVAECMPIAFDTLLAIGRDRKVGWPEPSGLPPWADKEMVERSRQYEYAEIKEAFIGSPPERTADRTFGVVKAWGESYPEKGSAARSKLVLLGVGYGIAAHLISKAVEEARAEGQTLRQQAAELLESQNRELEDALKQERKDIAAIDQLLAASARLYNEVVPELIWQRTAPVVTEEAAKVLHNSGVSV